jgi:hypothetical protein
VIFQAELRLVRISLLGDNLLRLSNAVSLKGALSETPGALSVRGQLQVLGLNLQGW